MIQVNGNKILAIVENGVPVVVSYSGGYQDQPTFPDKYVYGSGSYLIFMSSTGLVPPYYIILPDGDGFDSCRVGNNTYGNSSPYYAKTLNDGAGIFYKCGYAVSFDIRSTITQTVRITPSRIYSTQSNPATLAAIPHILFDCNANETRTFAWNGVLRPYNFEWLYAGDFSSHFQYTWVYGPSFMCDYPANISITNVKYGWSFA